MTTIALLAGLAGSIITVFLEKIIEYFTVKQKNKHEIKKVFYERKLKSAEAAVSSWTQMTIAIGSLATLYDHFAENIEMNLEVVYGFEESFRERLQIGMDSSNELASSILLYFDFEDEKFWDIDSLRGIVENLSALKSIFESAKYITDLISKTGDDNLKAVYEVRLEHLRSESKERLKKLSEVYSDSTELAKDFLKRIRNDMKQFEYDL